MKRHLCLMGLLLVFAIPKHVYAKTDTIRFEVTPAGTSGTLNYVFSAAVRAGIEMEWVADNSKKPDRFSPDADGKYTQTITAGGTGYIYYTYEQGSTYTMNIALSTSGSSDISIGRGNENISLLDVSGCTALTDLQCYKNQLTALDASGCTALDRLSCYNNQLTALNVSGCTALTRLECYNNQLTALNVSGCTALTYLHCYFNQLTALNVSGCTALMYLHCQENQLTALDVSNCTALNQLKCDNNQLTSLDVSQNTALGSLYCSGNQLSSLNLNTALGDLQCNNNQLTSLDVSQNTDLMYLQCNNNQLTRLDISQNTSLRTLQCNKNQLTGLEVSKLAKLTELQCYNNRLTSLDVSQNTALKTLQCYNTSLTSLDVSANTALTTLQCYNTSLTSLDVSANTSLTTLQCYNNHIPLSVLYNIYSQKDNWISFSAFGQSATISLRSDDDMDLSSEMTLGETRSIYTVKEFAGGIVSADDYTENDFVFHFNKPGEYELRLSNPAVLDGNITYRVTVRGVYTLSLDANPAIGGSVSQSGEGTYEYGTKVTITATPAEAYYFVNWTKDGEEVSTEAVYTFTLSENLELTANFEEIPPVVVETYTVSLAVNNPAWGSVSQSGSGTYEEGEEATVTATANEGYRFVNWTKNGAEFSKEAEFTFTVKEDLELTANFEEIPPVVVETYTVSLAVNNPAWGNVFQSGSGTYEEGEEATITATANEGYRFISWTKDGEVFSTEATYKFIVTEDLELTANFEQNAGNEGRENDNFYVYAQDRNIVLSETRGSVQVFNAIGQCVYSGNATLIPVRWSGVYVVLVGAGSYKVVVR